MYDDVLQKMRQSTKRLHYRITDHVSEELDKDALTAYDVEQVILTGNIIKRQFDKGWGYKYIVRGQTAKGGLAEVAARLEKSGKVIIITAYIV